MLGFYVPQENEVVQQVQQDKEEVDTLCHLVDSGVDPAVNDLPGRISAQMRKMQASAWSTNIRSNMLDEPYHDVCRCACACSFFHGRVGAMTSLSCMRHALQAVAKQITHLLEYVSLNMRGIRKIVKKLAKHIPMTEPVPGFLTLEISHPHDPGWKVVEVYHCSSSSSIPPRTPAPWYST